MYTTLGTALYTLLNDSGFKSTNGIAAVYNYAEREMVTYPVLTIVAQSHEASFADTTANVRIFTFIVRALVRAGSDADSEAAARALIDAVIDRLESNMTLAGACDFMTPTAAQFNWSSDDIPVRYADVTVHIKKRYIR